MSKSPSGPFHTLRLVLGDQLNHSHSWYRQQDPGVLYLLAELRQETDYTRHHVQKICAFFAAMAAFAAWLEGEGHAVLYMDLDDTAAYPDLVRLLARLASRFEVRRVEYQRPDELRVATQLQALALGGGITIQCRDSEHFMLPFEEIGSHFPSGRHLRMETFYRKMRRRFDILMEDGQPLQGEWNFDARNRNRLGAADMEKIPQPLLFANDVRGILERLQRHQVATLGEPSPALIWPVDRVQSLRLLHYFCASCLPRFGHFQDAMTGRSEHGWSLHHSRLSFALNCKLLSPGEVIDAAVERFHAARGAIALAEVEGFVRQILGWREYVRGVYWSNMPSYGERNALGATRSLPGFFWTGRTRMRCLALSIGQSLEHAYAHHIQRLMITGNFCLLAGIDPDQVDDWYLGIYIDALQWVELPNTRGMSQYADGGLVATKPYAASGNYVNRMGDYCQDCHYRVRERTGSRACPLNSLYWHFMDRHRELLGGNQRIGMAYRTWDRLPAPDRRAILAQAEGLLASLESL